MAKKQWLVFKSCDRNADVTQDIFAFEVDHWDFTTKMPKSDFFMQLFVKQEKMLY